MIKTADKVIAMMLAPISLVLIVSAATMGGIAGAMCNPVSSTMTLYINSVESYNRNTTDDTWTREGHDAVFAAYWAAATGHD